MVPPDPDSTAKPVHRRSGTAPLPAVLLGLSILFLPVPAGVCGTDPALEQYQAAVRVHDMQGALAILKPLARRGNAEACYQLAALYRSGNGVPNDHKAAFYWLGKAASQGHTQAMYNLGVMYENGWGTPADPAAARKWYRKAADKGYAMAARKLAHLRSSPAPAAGSAATEDLLRHAVTRNDSAEIRQLLARGARVDSTDHNGKSVLMDAAEQGQLASLELLLKHTHAINAQNRHGDTALQFAVRENHRAAVSALLSAGASPDLAEHDLQNADRCRCCCRRQEP